MTVKPNPSTAQMLFIGNSYTARNQLPQLIAALAATAEHPVQVEVGGVFAGGASLRRHWNAGVAQKSLASAAWNYVVLQEQSTLPVKNPARYHENVRLFSGEIAKQGAKTVLYLTWSRQQAPQTQDQITRAVETIAAEVDAQIVPVGPLWHIAMHRHPGLKLCAADGSHPTAAGSYLAACAFLVGLFDQRPSGWLVSDGLAIDRNAAAELHALAWETRATR